MARIIFISLMLCIILGMNFYVFFRIGHLIPAGNVLKLLVVPLAIALVGSFFLGLFGGWFMPSTVVSFFYKVGTAWFFIALYLVLAFVLLDLLRLVLPMKQVLSGNWLTLGGLAVLMMAVFSYGYLHYRHKERVELSLTIAKPIAPLKIVALSDLHLGYSIGKEELDEWIKLINAERPDLVLIAGDIIDNSPKPLFEQDIAASFRNIRSKYGVFASLGNHEYIGDATKLRQSIDFLRQANITLLRDSVALVGEAFYVIGRDDRSNPHRKSLAELLAPLDHSKPLILIDHQPYHLDEAERNGIDLQLSGHTHRGQVAPFSCVTDRLYKQSHGYLRKSDTHIYVSSGIGIWGGKFRIGTQSEYVVVQLKSEQRPLR